MHMTTIKQALQDATRQLEHHEEARLEAEVLLCHTLGVSRAFLYAHSDDSLPPNTEEAFNQLIYRRKQGEPVAYLTGSKEFWSLPLRVNLSTLIPRSETELLVEKTLLLAPDKACDVLELGTGSGAISIALAHEKPHWHFQATDISGAALETAMLNAQSLSLTHIHFLQSDWFSALPSGCFFDVIVSNPPYIEEDDPHLFQGDLRFEPKNALASGSDGLDALRTIINEAGHFLKPGGLLALEHGYQQADTVKALLQAKEFRNIICHRDLQGHPRVTTAYAHAPRVCP